MTNGQIRRVGTFLPIVVLSLIGAYILVGGVEISVARAIVYAALTIVFGAIHVASILPRHRIETHIHQ